MNTFNIIRVLILVFCGYSLSLKFNKTKGLYKKAKVVHSVIILYLIYFHWGALNWAILYLKDSPRFFNHFTEDVGIISAKLNSIANLVDLPFAILVLISALGCVQLIDRWRRALVYSLPFLIPGSIITFYVVVKKSSPLSDITILLIGLIIFSINFAGISFLYTRKFMLDLFENSK